MRKMKTFMRHMAWGFLAVALAACSKDPEFETTDVGPVLEKIAFDERASMGDIIAYEFRISDPLPLSTLDADLYFDNDLVASASLRVKSDGIYRDTLSVPFYKEIPDGEATVVITGRNIRFGETQQRYKVRVERPDFDHLTFVMDGEEYRMERIAPYEYAVTDDFPQKAKGYIEAPAFASGEKITFGWDVNQVISGSTTLIPFSQSNAGECTISFNTLTFAASPFTKLLFNGEEMSMVDNDNYSTVAMLTQGVQYEISGIPDFGSWDVDRDFFERGDESQPGVLTFLPMSGQYKVTANFKHNYLKIEAMKSATELAVLNGDGSGAVWAIGGKSVGKPSLNNAYDWKTESGGLCLARVGSTKYQLTLVGGVSIDTKSVDFKFFHQKTWGGEFGGGKITTTSETFVAGENDGNIRLAEGKTLKPGYIYRFILDVTPNAADTKLSTAVLTVEEIEGGDHLLGSGHVRTGVVQSRLLRCRVADAAAGSGERQIPHHGQPFDEGHRCAGSQVRRQRFGDAFGRRPRRHLLHRLRHWLPGGGERTRVDDRKGDLHSGVCAAGLQDHGAGRTEGQHGAWPAFPRERMEREILQGAQLGRHYADDAGARDGGAAVDQPQRQQSGGSSGRHARRGCDV